MQEIDLWAGVPPISPDLDDVTTLLKPVAGPKPPVSVAERVELPFPPPAPPSKQTQDPAPVGPLKVLRTSPTQKTPGDVGTVSAVFNQAMVPLASVDDLKLERSPMSITPQPRGKFRWLGAQMIAFEAEGRLPYSTTYTAEVAAGEKSTSGTEIAKPVQWKFTTPALEIETAWPQEWGHAALDSLVVVRFNQDIQTDKLADALALTSGGGAKVGVTVVPAGSWATLDPPYRGLAEGGKPGRTLVLRPAAPLAADTAYTLTIPAGVYGEGPNASKKLTAKFRTYPPLTLTAPHCRQHNWDCHAINGVVLHPSTPLIDDPQIASKVRVTPEVPELKVTAGGGGLALRGKFRGLGSYTIEVDPGVRDIHGQELAKPFRATIKLAALDPGLQFDDVARDPVVLEPSHAGVLSLRATGLTQVEVRSRSLTAAELPSVLTRRHNRDGRDEWIEGLESATTTTIEVGASRSEAMVLPQKTRELARMPGSFLLLGARSNLLGDSDWKYRQEVDRIVEVTRLGVSAALDKDSGVILVTDIETGLPMSGVAVSLHTQESAQTLWSGATDERGLAELTHGDITSYATPYILAKASGGDVSYTPLDQALDGQWTHWQRKYEDSRATPFFFTDRQPYKPGDTVHLSAILRQESRGPQGGVSLYRTDVTCTYVVRGPRGHEIAKGEVKVGPLGTLSLDVPLPADTDLGDHVLELTVPAGLFAGSNSFYHSFAVQAYRAPEFEVKVERAAATTLIYGDTLEADVRGVYLHGAPMVGAEVSYTLRRSDAGFRPPGSENEPFSFGPQPRPWWWGDDFSFGGGGVGGGGNVLVKQGSGETDGRGVFAVSHALQARETPWNTKGKPSEPDKESKDPPTAGTYTLEAQVVDQNRQALAGRQSFVVHGAEEYVGVRSDRTVYKEGEMARVEAIVTDVDGKRISGRKIGVALVRSETKRTAVEKDGRWSYKYETVDVPSGTCSLVSDAAPVSCDIAVGQAGSYVARADIADAKGRPAATRHTIYVHGKDAVVWNQDQRRVDIVPDKRTYEPGESATLLVRSPFDAARGLVIVEREGIVEHREILVEGGAATVTVPLTEAMIPGAHVAVVLVRGRVDVPGAPADQDLGRPAVASGRIELDVASTRKQVALTLVPDRSELAPKDTLKLEIQARDADGAPQKAMVAVMVVDEGVLSLMAYKTPDPLSFFHHDREGGVGLYDLRTFLLARPEADIRPPTDDSGDGVDQQAGYFNKSPYNGSFAVGNDDADVWGSLTGTEIGDAYGVGGLGLVGTGRGGGGTGEGTIGLGNTGLIGKGGGGGADRAEPEPETANRHKGEEGRMGKPTSRARSLEANEAMAQAISLRTQFATTAYFNPEVVIGETGTATLEIPMPENLTSFRVMAVAVDPDHVDRFGSAETRVKVRKPIMLRPSLPRFTNFGDSFQASVMVDNQTSEPQAILVGARGTNVVLPGATTVPVEVPAGESREVRFPMAVDRVGTMRLQFAALSNGGRDATEASLPVLFPATRQAFADYGMTDTSVLRALKVPEGALPGFGGLEVSLSSTALKGLEDAVKYLVEYSYECTEQVASRLLPIFVLGPVIEQFPIATVRDRERRKQLGVDGIARILGRQNYDGGFRYWDDADRSSPYLTAWATFALLEGKQDGFKVDEDRLARALRYLANFVENGESTPWGRYYDHTSRAFALWLISREGRGGDLFDRVYAKRKEIPLYARLQLMSAAHKLGRTGERDALLKDLRARVTETARTAHFAESTSQAEAEGLQLLMHSNVQTDAIALMALLEISPDDPLLPKVMAGILDDRDPQRGGRWGTTHANAWALLAASRYFKVVEKEVPDYVARIWLDTAFAGEQAFKGRSMTTTEQTVPMATLLKDQPREVLLAKDGPGKLYYRLGLRYAPADLLMKAESQGFSVFRSYEPLAQGGDPVDPESVRRLPDGSYEIKAGALVRVNLTLVARDRANFVVVDDPLPAGFEGQNASFATTLQDVNGGVTSQSYDRGGGDMWGDAEDGWWWWRPWWSFSHTELRDDRMLLFANHLPAGVYTYSYTARATTIGEFQLPPIHAEAMYAPEQFGHSASAKVRIVE